MSFIDFYYFIFIIILCFFFIFCLCETNIEKYCYKSKNKVVPIKRYDVI